MSARNLDKHNRFRCITVGFRVSPEEHEHINVAVALSGLSKQEYCYRRCLGRDIVVQGNPKVYKALKDQLAAVLDELKRIEAGQSVDDELLENINLITRTLQGLNKICLSLPRKRRPSQIRCSDPGASPQAISTPATPTSWLC